MEFQEDPLLSVVEEIAALLATGYLRLRKARTVSESAAPPTLQPSGEPLNSATGARAHVAMSLTPREKRESS
jgi:hypothetical protein